MFKGFFKKRAERRQKEDEAQLHKFVIEWELWSGVDFRVGEKFWN